MLLNCGVGEDSWESLGLQGDPTSPFWRRSALGFLWKEWCWSLNSSTWPPHAKSWLIGKDWCWEGLGAGGKGDDRGGDSWMASLTGWTWVWVNSGSWWWTGRPDVVRFMGLQRVRQDWATNSTELSMFFSVKDSFYSIRQIDLKLYIPFALDTISVRILQYSLGMRHLSFYPVDHFLKLSYCHDNGDLIILTMYYWSREDWLEKLVLIKRYRSDTVLSCYWEITQTRLLCVITKDPGS